MVREEIQSQGMKLAGALLAGIDTANMPKPRDETGALCIIVLTRWATDDLAGRVMNKFLDQCYELKISALTEDNMEGVSTCEDLYLTEDLQNKRKTLDEDV